MGSANTKEQIDQLNTQGTTMNIECTLVEEHLKEMARLKAELEQTTSKNLALDRQLKESEENSNSLRSKCDKTIDDMMKNISLLNQSEIQRKKDEEAMRLLQRNNELLTKQNGNLQLQLVELKSITNEVHERCNQATQEMENKSSKFDENNKMWDTKYNKLNSQYSKLQSEVQRYKSNKVLNQFVELQPQLQKLISQVDATAKKFTKESQSKKRPINETELDVMTSVYLQNAAKLAMFNPTLAEKFTASVKTYKELCANNDKKVLDAMKSVYDIDKNTKSLDGNAKSEINSSVQKMKTSVEKYTKEIAELKKKTFGNDFKQEEKLGTDLLQIYYQLKTISNNVPNNLNATIPTPSTSKIDNTVVFENIPKPSTKNTNGKKVQNKNEDLKKFYETGWNFNMLDEKDKNCCVILYDFPENTIDGVEHEAVDLINVKYFLGKLGLGDVKDIAVRRLPASNNVSPRPVVIRLPNEETVNQILASPHKLAELGLQNTKIGRFNGKI